MNRAERREAERKHIARLAAFSKLTPAQQDEIKEFYNEELNKTWNIIEYQLYNVMRENKISEDRACRILAELPNRLDEKTGKLKLFPTEVPKIVTITKDDFSDLCEFAVMYCKVCRMKDHENCALNELLKKFGAPTCDSIFFSKEGTK